MLEKLKMIYPNREIEFEGKGWHSEAYTMGDYIIRVPINGDIASYEKEQKILDFLSDKITFEIPKISIIAGELPHSIHRKLLGRKWGREDYLKLTDMEKDLFAADGALFFAQLHSVDYNQLGGLLKIMEQKLFDFDRFKNAFVDYFEFNKIDKLYNFYIEYFNRDGDRVLIHDDFWENNVLMTNKNRLKAIFDFGNASIEFRAREFRSIFDDSFYSDLYGRILREYEKILNITVDLDEIKDSRIIDSIGVILWLNENKKAKEEKMDSLLEHIEIIQKFLYAL